MVKIVAVIPAYNEELHIADIVQAMQHHADEVVVVSDGSSDMTVPRAQEAGARIVVHRLRCGPGAATMTGICAARALGAQAVITIDADDQHHPEDAPALLAPIRDGSADIVIGSRFKQANDIPVLVRVFNTVGNLLTFLTTGKYVSDSQSGYKAFGPVALKEIELHMNGYEFCTEIVREMAQNHWRVQEVPIAVTYSAYARAKGQSFSRGVITACKILLRSFLR